MERIEVAVDISIIYLKISTDKVNFDVNCFMRLFLIGVLILVTTQAGAQANWVAPEGFTVNQRTLTWEDFKGKEDKDLAADLASRNLQAAAYVSPAIYFTADSGRVENGRVKFNFHIKCAFQSRAFVRESTKQQHSNYVLIHEQDHYDIALTYARKMQDMLSSRDYSADKCQEEVDKLCTDLLDKYEKTQKTYDGEVNPDGRDEVEKQHLWDMRIKKGLENNTDEFYNSPEQAVKSVAEPGTIVKRIPGEPALQFVVRARPLYTEFSGDMKAKVMETTEWSETPAVIAFYTQKYYLVEDGAVPKDNFRTLAFIFMPTANNFYKRILIDTFTNNGKPVRIGPVFFANADSDQAKELVIMANCSQPDGMVYYNRIYDNIFKPMPPKLKRLDEADTKISSGFEGLSNGREVHAKYKTEDQVKEALQAAHR